MFLKQFCVRARDLNGSIRAQGVETHHVLLRSRLCLYSEVETSGKTVRHPDWSKLNQYRRQMGISYLRESIRFERCKHDRIKTSSRPHQSIRKKLEPHMSSRIRRLRPDEFLVGNINGFQVTKRIRQRKKTRNAESTIRRQRERAAANCCRAPTDPKLRMIKVARRYAQKRKLLSPDKSAPQDGWTDFERNVTPKKIKMDSDRSPFEDADASLGQPLVSFQTQMTDTPKVTPEKRKDPDGDDHAPATGAEEVAEESRISTPPSRSVVTRKRRKTLPPVEEKLSDAIRYEDACLRTSKNYLIARDCADDLVGCKSHDEPASAWRSNFLRKCAELVEVRFRGPIRITCVKPFYVQFRTCWQESNAVRHLETSDLPVHQESRAVVSEYDNCVDAFTSQETEILVRNFFQISKAYSLRHPYLIACIQTGLETRKEIYDFNKFRSAHQIIEKLCVDIPDKDSRACLMQLRTFLTPQLLPYSHFEAENVIANLFAGFGPDWNTISKLTGFNQITLKTAVALYHKMDLGAITPQVWFDIHQRILDAYEIDLNASKSSEHSSRMPRSVPPSTPCEPTQYNFVGELHKRKRLKLPSFNSIFSPL